MKNPAGEHPCGCHRQENVAFACNGGSLTGLVGGPREPFKLAVIVRPIAVH
jgi:hypothetical protein